MKLYKEQLIESVIGDEDDVEVVMNVSAGVIVRKDENNTSQVLLIQRAEDDHFPLYYEFPRGKCDKPIGESLLSCAKREIKEETGLDVVPIKLIDTFEYLADQGKRKSICHNFLCRMKDPNQKVKLSHEHQNFKWIQSVGETELLVLPDQKKSIEKAFNEDLQIVSYPENHFTKNNSMEEYLQWLSQKKI